MTEIWKDVVGYEGLYQVSDLGNVRSLYRYGVYSPKEKATQTNNYGYKTVMLSKDGVSKRVTVHRLVAIAFLPNPRNAPQINHIDENKANNCVSNLEWCDAKHNCSSYARNHPHKSRRGKRKGKPVIQLSKAGEYIRTWDNARQVFVETGMSDWSISQCCRGIWKTAYGYKWQYANYIQQTGKS